MKIALVNPPQIELREPTAYVPLGLGYIASNLIRNGFEDIRIDNLAGLKKDEYIKLDYADIFGITYMSAARSGVSRVIEYIRDKFGEESKIIIGGPHPSVKPYNTYKEIDCDYLITGEAEELFIELVKYTDQHNAYNNGIYNAGIIKNLDMLPFPARKLFRYDNMVNITGIHGCEKGIKSTTVITSRGCPYVCKFCCRKHVMYRKYRYRSPENVRDELIELKDSYGIEHVRFVDDCLTFLKERIKKICQYTKELGITFMCITRADKVNIDILKVLKEGGCTSIDIGVETGSPRLLKMINKKETVEQMKDCILNAKKIDLKTKVFLQYGLPTETKNDIDMTMDFLRETKPNYFTLSRFTPLPGSELEYIHNKKEGWFYNDNDKIRKILIDDIKGILEA